MTAPLVIFTHIPKTAGTTLKRIIRAQFPRSRALDVNAVPPADWPKAMAELPESVQIVMGNARYGLHRHTARPCRYFTILRDPVEREISGYYHILREPTHHLHAEYNADKVDLLTNVRRLPNLQTKYIAGTAPNQEIDETDFARARENLAQAFEVFGLIENFDATLAMFVKAFGWSTHGYVKHNVNASKPKSDRVSPEARAAIAELCAYDVKLYDFARQLFEKRIQEQPASFQRDLARLSRGSEWMQRRQRVASGVCSLLARIGLARR
jgi:hypothetical protein